MKAKVFSSGAMRPARAPPSIVMLQTVIRPSIERARIASPAYSMTWPVPPAVPISPMMARMMSLAVTPSPQRAVDEHAHVLRFRLDQRLRREHMLDFRRADAMRQRAESAMRRGMAVAADDGRARQGEALLGTDDMDDALADVVLVEIFDAEILGIGGERLDLHAALGIVDCPSSGRWSAHCDRRRRASSAARAPCVRQPQPFEGLRGRHLMDEMAVDIEEARAVVLAIDQMVVPRSCRRACGARPSLKHSS